MPNAVPGQRAWFAAALLVAIVVRVALLAEKPFWRDEVWVALAAEAPLAAMTERPRPLPVGFLAVTQLATYLPLPPEVGYRLVPLAAGLALVPLLGRFALALGAPLPVALAAVWLAAGAPALVYYSRELKSYGLDALIAVLVPLLALRLFGRGAGAGVSPPRAGAALLVVLAVAPWLTFGTAFVVAAVLAWGWGWWWPAAPRGPRRWWLAASVAYAVSFALVFHFFLGAQSTSPTLHQVWRPMALDAAAASWLARVARGAGRFATLTLEYALLVPWPVALVPVLLGAWCWPRRGRALLCWLYLGAGAATLGAALAGRFLIGEERLLLFALPPLLLATAAGLVALGGWLGRDRGATVALAAAATFSLVWSGRALAHRLVPGPDRHFVFDIVHDVDGMLAASAALIPVGEPVYVAQFASRAFKYYGNGRFADATVCWERCELTPVTSAWLDRHERRGWLVLSADDVGWLTTFFAANGVAHEERLSRRGMRLWRVWPRDDAAARSRGAHLSLAKRTLGSALCVAIPALVQ